MAIQQFKTVFINNTPITYEGTIDVKPASITRKKNPQIQGKSIITQDISTNTTQITITVRNTDESSNFFEKVFNNGDNNTITLDDKIYTEAVLTVLPSQKDQETSEYVFES